MIYILKCVNVSHNLHRNSCNFTVAEEAYGLVKKEKRGKGRRIFRLRSVPDHFFLIRSIPQELKKKTNSSDSSALLFLGATGIDEVVAL